jgi:WD40 repeat protein/biotin carboxyl carrier protein
MARFFVSCLLIAALCTAAVMVLGKSLWPDATAQSGTPNPSVKRPVVPEPRVEDGLPIAAPPAAASLPGRSASREDDKPVKITELAGGGVDTPLTILDAKIMAIQQQNVPAERDGKLLFLATDIQEGEFVPKGKELTYEVVTLGVRVTTDEEWKRVPSRDRMIVQDAEGKVFWYRVAQDNDDLTNVETALIPRTYRLRTLDVGDRVRPGQMLGLVNPVLAIAEVRKQQERVEAAKADVRASITVYEEAKRRYERDRELNRKGGKVISPDELAISLVTAERYREEAAAKQAAVKSAQSELSAVYTAMRQHIVRSSIDGVIRQVYKQPGEAVKNLDPVVQVHNPGKVRVDAQVEVQDALVLRARLNEAVRHRNEASRLWAAELQNDPRAPEPPQARVLRALADQLIALEVEASRQEPPLAVLTGHAREVLCVGVTSEKNPRIISGSEDHTVRIWQRIAGEDRWAEQIHLDHKAVIRSLAVTGPKAGKHLLLTGTATGRARIFDLSNIREGEKMLDSRHTGSINACAFDTNGNLCVTGGEDASLILWDVAEGKLLGRVPNAHRAAVTSVTFTSKGQVVSAGRDKRLVVWNIAEGGEGGRTLVYDHHEDRRSGEVANLGVSPNGETVIFDEGRELRILSLSQRKIIGVLRNASGTAGFGHFALFSPDGKSILTGCNATGRTQLWRAPNETTRPSEMRQYQWSATETCASFDPNGQYAVTGTQDNRVLVWKMPDRLEVEKPLPGELTFVEEFLDVSARKLSIRATVENPGWVIPGASATIVVPPLKR